MLPHPVVAVKFVTYWADQIRPLVCHLTCDPQWPSSGSEGRVKEKKSGTQHMVTQLSWLWSSGKYEWRKTTKLEGFVGCICLFVFFFFFTRNWWYHIRKYWGGMKQRWSVTCSSSFCRKIIVMQCCNQFPGSFLPLWIKEIPSGR